MIRYIYVRSKSDDMASLVYCTAQKPKIKEKLKTKPISLEETVRAKVRESSPEYLAKRLTGKNVSEMIFFEWT